MDRVLLITAENTILNFEVNSIANYSSESLRNCGEIIYL